MQIDECSVTSVINGVNYCIVLIHEKSFLDELNHLPPEKVAILLTSTACLWYVAGVMKEALGILKYDGDIT